MRWFGLSTWMPMVGLCMGLWTYEKGHAKDSAIREMGEEKLKPITEKQLQATVPTGDLADGDPAALLARVDLVAEEEVHIREARAALEQARRVLFPTHGGAQIDGAVLEGVVPLLATAKEHMDSLHIRAWGKGLFRAHWVPIAVEPSVRWKFEQGKMSYADLFPPNRGPETTPGAREKILREAAIEVAEARAEVFRLETIRRIGALEDESPQRASLYDLWMARTKLEEAEGNYNDLLRCKHLGREELLDR